jgi:hypothetical protein
MSIYLFAKEGSLISYPFTCISSLIYYTFFWFISLRLSFQSCNGMIEGLKGAMGNMNMGIRSARLHQILSPPRGDGGHVQRHSAAFGHLDRAPASSPGDLFVLACCTQSAGLWLRGTLLHPNSDHQYCTYSCAWDR